MLQQFPQVRLHQCIKHRLLRTARYIRRRETRHARRLARGVPTRGFCNVARLRAAGPVRGHHARVPRHPSVPQSSIGRVIEVGRGSAFSRCQRRYQRATSSPLPASTRPRSSASGRIPTRCRRRERAPLSGARRSWSPSPPLVEAPCVSPIGRGDFRGYSSSRSARFSPQ